MASQPDPATAAAQAAAPFEPELRVRDATAAALLIDTRRNRWLHPFLARPCGLSEAARQLGVGRSGVAYWVRQLSAAGLLRPTVDAHGRPAWRSTADRLVVALADAPQDSDAAILAAQLDPAYAAIKRALLHAAQRHPSPWQFVLERQGEHVHQRLAPVRGTLGKARIVNQRALLHLGDEDAEALRKEMMALHERYAARSVEGKGRRRVLTWLCAVDDPVQRQRRQPQAQHGECDQRRATR